MQCPKCKKEINQNNVLKCPYCNTKIASACKDCGHINLITATVCANCNKALLYICPSCGAANLPEAKICRKCGEEFKISYSPKPEYNAETGSQQKIKVQVIDAIKNADTSIITICGESGSGKNLILRSAINELKNAKIIWLLGTCSQTTQLSPFGYFQDLLLNFFNINNFCPDTLQLKKNSIHFFKQDFPTLSNNEILDLLNLLYPEQMDKYENIYQNKAKTFNILKKVFLTIVEKIKSVFIIDNFDNIDGMSFDFLKELLEDDYILERCKFIIRSKISKPGMGLISSTKLNENNYANFTIAPFTQIQVEAQLSHYGNINISKNFSDYVYRLSGGNPSIVEQAVMLLKDSNKNGYKYVKHNSLDNIIDARLGILKTEDLSAYRMLVAMSVLGVKFYPAMLEYFDNNSPQEFQRIIEKLIQSGYISQLNNLSFEFKSNSVWHAIVLNVINDDSFEQILNILYETLGIYKQSSIALIGYLVQKLRNDDKAFDIWTILMKQASYIGDVGLYIIAQKQSLKLIENKNNSYYQHIKKNIYTRVGKLLEPIDFVTAFEYLQNAIMMIENDDYEHIELLGYLASASMKKGNYWGVIECTDSVLNMLSDGDELSRALIKSRQVRPLVKLGNYGQVINLIDNEILPIIEKYISKGKNTEIITIENLYLIWLDIHFDLAEALTFQGDCRMFDVIKLIFDAVEKNNTTDAQAVCQAHLALALANTIKGDLKTSEKILDDILKEHSLDNLNPFIVSRWNFIDILNKFMNKDYDNVYNELFNVVAYANNNNDNFTKNILKTLLAKMLQDKNDNKKALELLEEHVAYFAKEKIATGVLLSWYLIAKVRLITKGTQFALDIMNKALDIAQGPNINNYYFIALYNRLISEIYISKQDYESAKVYLAKSIFVAKQFNMEAILVQDYIQYAKFYQELALPKTANRGEYIKQALKMFQLAKNVNIVEDHLYLQRKIKDELGILTSFCKLNGIMLKKTSK